MYKIAFLLCLVVLENNCMSNAQYGPDPWNYEEVTSSTKVNNDDVPPDLKLSPRRKKIQSDNGVGMSEWFYKRILSILMKGGNVEKNLDNSMEVTIQMHFSKERWMSLNEYLALNNAFSEDIYRRSLGYVEEAILKPTIAEKIVWAWTDYVQFYIGEYQMYITWFLGFFTAVLTTKYIWDHMSHRHIIFTVCIAVYFYEAFISYKEAEQHEYDRFISAVNTCRWHFWSSQCDIPAPNPLVFFKHMHPVKIGMRLFTMLISEPVLALSSTVKALVHGITDDLWYPLDKVVFTILVVVINVLLLVFLIMILFNFVLRIPFNISFLAGLVNIGISGGNRTRRQSQLSDSRHITGTEDRISGANLEKLLNVCAKAAQKQVWPKREQKILNQNKSIILHKSASTGRLSELASTDYREEGNSTGRFRSKPWCRFKNTSIHAQGDQMAVASNNKSSNEGKEAKR